MSKGFVFTKKDIPSVQVEVDNLKELLQPVMFTLDTYIGPKPKSDYSIQDIANLLVCNTTDAERYVKAYHEYHIGVYVLASLATVGKCTIKAYS